MEQWAAGVDKLENILDEHGRRIGENERRIGRLSVVVYGDEEQKFHGLVERTELTEKTLEQMAAQWRDVEIRYETIILFLRIGVAVSVIIAAGTWAPQLEAILSLLGG